MKTSLISLLSLCLSLQTYAKTYVSPTGNDRASGSKSAPLKTLHKALAKASRQQDKRIILLDGLYELKRTVKLSSKHSGISIKAAQLGKATISGAYSFMPQWKSYKGQILVCDLPADLKLGDDAFDQMTIAAQQQRIARYPNYDASQRFFGGVSADCLSAERIKTWKNPKGGFIHSLHGKEWGGDHWRITGKKSDTEITREGGWMNNRPTGLHASRRFVENIFEELDAPGEWFLNRQEKKLYFYPPVGLKFKGKKIRLARLETLFHFAGSLEKPVKNIHISGVSFKNTARSFMKTKEPLLRSDWRFFRGAALFFEGAENCQISYSEMTQLGGNVVVASGYNKGLKFSRNHVHHVGANAFAFVGLPKSVWNPMYDPYGKPIAWDKINKTDKGPKTEDYPRECSVTDSLIHDVGLWEKQAAPIQISMAYRITIKHCSIYNCPRAGINIGENAFGGHLIDYCDVFNTVLETGDHGAFNSWGRDRYWHLNYGLINQQVAQFPELPKIDMLEPNTIRNSRWRCDHGWDIDLDDGSSWYKIYNNLCLKGGIKLREGYYRTVENNIMLGNTFHPHIWFTKSEDIFRKNIVAQDYAHIRLAGWGKEVDYNFFPTQNALEKAQSRKTDQNSLYGKIEFRNPDKLDFRLKKGSKAFNLAFKDLPVKKFGVKYKALKAIAQKPKVPHESTKKGSKIDQTIHNFLGAKVKNLATMGELSATGMDSIRGVFFFDVAKNSQAAKKGLKSGDVLIEIEWKAINRYEAFIKIWDKADQPLRLTLMRNQKKHHIHLAK